MISQRTEQFPAKKQNTDTYAAYLAKINGEIEKHILEGLEYIGWKNLVKRDSTLFVKPNFTFPQYRNGITTSPELLRSLLRILKDRCNKVILGESDGGNHSFRAGDAFAGHGVIEMCKELGVELVNLSTLPSVYVESKVQSRKVRVQLPRMLLEKIDCFLSVPVLKVHVMTGVSLGIKNLWGCYPDTMRGLYHQNLDRKLALIARLLNPKITVVDGTYGLTSHGPMFGDAIKLDLILLSNNIVVADTIGAMIMGIPLERAKHIAMAEKEGIGSANLMNVKVNTDWRKYRRQFQTRKTLLDNTSKLLFASHNAARFVFASPFTPLIYKVARSLRSAEEKTTASQLEAYGR